MLDLRCFVQSSSAWLFDCSDRFWMRDGANTYGALWHVRGEVDSGDESSASNGEEESGLHF